MEDPLEEKTAKQYQNLQKALALEPTRLNKDATIQRFEFSFELSWKLMNAINKYKGVSSYGPRESIRTAHLVPLVESLIQKTQEVIKKESID